MTLISIYYALFLYACNDILVVKRIKLFIYRYLILVDILRWHDSYVLHVVTTCLVLSLLLVKYSYGSQYLLFMLPLCVVSVAIRPAGVMHVFIVSNLACSCCCFFMMMFS